MTVGVRAKMPNPTKHANTPAKIASDGREKENLGDAIISILPYRTVIFLRYAQPSASVMDFLLYLQ